MAGRFSKCPEERERILQKRKEHLIHAARKRYIEKKHGASESWVWLNVIVLFIGVEFACMRN